ncbi:membrane protein [Cupriavidus sp. SK-4]|uniref:porin n=1 Tax=Cupriavidus sp. SK-4 TaxID=574750 RepID=UPI00044E6F78|nr:porin [Cupriavidus sp. SK-4]EYS97651.1 membrane protein [Cupriavidus sp. SK-4]
MKLRANVLLAAIAGACSTSAVAQSSVTLYGLVDTGFEYINHLTPGDHSVFRMTPGNMAGSRWGIRGVEDLGSNLKGVFVLESGFESDTGRSSQGGRLFGRSAYVGLQGQWGSLLLGRQTNALYGIAGDIDPMGIMGRYSLLANDGAFVGRADNTVKYVGKFGGLQASAMYSFGAESGTANGSEVPGNSKLGREFGGNFTYTTGPFSIAAAYDELNTGTTTVNPDATARRATVASTYAFQKAKVYVGYRWAKAYDGALLPGAPVAGNQRSNLWWTGVRWEVTQPLQISAAVYYQDFADTKADPWMFAVNADYSFSKRTDAYISVGYTKNRNGSNLGLGGGGYGFGTVQAGANQFGTAIGLRHRF